MTQTFFHPRLNVLSLMVDEKRSMKCMSHKRRFIRYDRSDGIPRQRRDNILLTIFYTVHHHYHKASVVGVVDRAKVGSCLFVNLLPLSSANQLFVYM